jgi:hypothetical protein
MSDFGAAISIVRKDGKSFSSSEKQHLEDALKNCITNDDLVNAIGETYNHELQLVVDVNPTLFIQLSEHYYGGNDEEDQETFDFVEETELGDANHIIASLKNQFTDYNFTASIEEW